MPRLLFHTQNVLNWAKQLWGSQSLFRLAGSLCGLSSEGEMRSHWRAVSSRMWLRFSRTLLADLLEVEEELAGVGFPGRSGFCRSQAAGLIFKMPSLVYPVAWVNVPAWGRVFNPPQTWSTSCWLQRRQLGRGRVASVCLHLWRSPMLQEDGLI